MEDIYIGRQAIFDRDLRVFAYELLYRAGQTNSAGQFDGVRATSQVVVNAFMEIGLSKVVGDHRAFINLTRSFLTGEHPVPFPKDNLVLEILEDVEVDDALLSGVRQLADEGYVIALDDFCYHTRYDELLDMADIVKLDLQCHDRDALEREVATLAPFDVKLVAEKVETQEDFEFCVEAGFDYFQGYFLCHPRVIKGQRVPSNRVATLRLLARLQDPAVQAGELETLISQDVSLSYKLLRYINSAFFALPRKVESIKQAVVYLGLRTIKTWVSLIVLSGIDDKPHELMTTALVRAKMCEQLAAAAGRTGLDTYFTVGLFSTLDAMMDAPMDKVLASLPLSDEISGALLRREGPWGEALRGVIAHERGEWSRTGFAGLGPAALTEAYLTAVEWAEGVNKELQL